MRRQNLLFFLLFLLNIGYGTTPIVFIHLGRMLPGYYRNAIMQARTFNPESPIYLIVHAQAMHQIKRKKWIPEDTKIIIAQHLTPSEKHKAFLRLPYRTINDSMLSFWRYSMERFFLLEEFMEAFDVNEAVHLEGDNLLYAELETLVPKLKANYPGIALPFLHDDECVPSFVYVGKRETLSALTQFLTDNVIGEGHRSDMTLLAMFAHQTKQAECLPSVPPEYVASESMKSSNGKVADDPSMYCNNAELLEVLFDPAPIGQYLDGESFRQINRRTSLVNENAVYNASLLPLHWKKDEKGRTLPVLQYAGKFWPLVNLHIHSKNLYKFAEENR